MDAARRAQAAFLARRPRQPRVAGHTAAGGAVALDLSAKRTIARADLARTSAGHPQIVQDHPGRWPALDVRRTVDARRGSTPQEPNVRLLLLFLLLVAAASHLL